MVTVMLMVTVMVMVVGLTHYDHLHLSVGQTNLKQTSVATVGACYRHSYNDQMGRSSEGYQGVSRYTDVWVLGLLCNLANNFMFIY